MKDKKRKRTEEELQKSEGYFRTLFDQAAVGVALTDTKTGRYVRINQKFCDFLGYTQEELLKGTFQVVTHPDDVQENVDNNALLLAGKIKEFSIDKRYIHKDGGVMWGNLTVSPLRTLGEEPATDFLHISVVQDITERVQAYESLRRSQQETAHVSSLLLALSQAAQAVHRARTSEEVYLAIQNQITQLGFHTIGFELGEDGQSLRIAYISYHANLIHKADKVTGLSLHTFRFKPRVNSIYQRVLHEGETIFLKDTAQAVADALPKKLGALVQPMTDLLDLGPSIFTPLLEGEKKIGVFSFTGSSLTEADIPAVTAFALQAAIAMQNAKLYEQAQQEIARRKQAEQALRESETYLKFSQQVAHVGHWIWNTRSNRIVWSDEMKRIFGLDPEQFDENLSEVISRAIHPDDREKVERANLAVIQEGKLAPMEYRIVLPDQTVRVIWAEAGDKDLDADGNIIRLMGIVQDITERKQAEEIAVASQKMAGIGSLAAGMAHEINSPLQLVTGLSDRLTRDLNADRIDKQQFLTDIAMINKNGWRIAHIVRSMLTYARGSDSELAPHQLNDIIESALLLIEHQLLSWSSISIEKELAAGLPLIHCDRNTITQVIINLLENARDALSEGGWITISTACSPENGQVILRVSDSGEGIPDQIQSRIFDPFFTTKEVGKGTGLGLSIVHGIVKTHGAEISVESAPRKGATFTICFPKEPQPMAALKDATAGRYN